MSDEKKRKIGDEAKADMMQKALDAGFKNYIATVMFNTAVRFSAGGVGLDDVVRGIDNAWGIREELIKHYGIGEKK